MAVTINGVAEKSRAQRVGIQPGDVLVAINGHEIIDVLDYRFFGYDADPELVLESASCVFREGRRLENISGRLMDLIEPQYAELGLEFETYLMDKQRSCRNKCVFCFIDQLPPGMRETLYFKDDDDRLSFLFGNYITLTNIDDREVDRILQMHISPINVSVHTMDPQLRCTMMHNRFAGDSLRHLYRLAEGHPPQLPDCAVPRRQRRPRPGAHLRGVLVPGGGASQRGLCAGGPHPLPGGPVPPGAL